MNTHKRKSLATAAALSCVVAAMLGLSLWSPTLYRLFCEATGFEGSLRTQNVPPPSGMTATEVLVRFDANVNSALSWRFHPLQREVRLRLGEEALIHYTAVNLSDKPVTGTATFNVVPEKAAPYFSKLECFCFTEQTLLPGQEVSMPVLFYVDPGLAEDPTTRDVGTITLSYTFYRSDNQPKPTASAAVTAPTATAGAGG